MKKLIFILLIIPIYAFAQSNSLQIQDIDKSIEQKAIGDLYFGDNWDIAKKSDVLKKSNKFRKHGIIVKDNYIVGNYKYRLRIVFDDNKEIDEVTISSYLNNASEFDDEIKKHFINLKSVFTHRYNNPVIGGDYPNILNYTNKTTVWGYGEKIISLKIVEQDHQYYVSASISLVNNKTIEDSKRTTKKLIENEIKSSEEL